eukprot:COSAG04_NODE_1754_length_5687_cov_2.326593_5_plen_135_part_00
MQDKLPLHRAERLVAQANVRGAAVKQVRPRAFSSKIDSLKAWCLTFLRVVFFYRCDFFVDFLAKRFRAAQIWMDGKYQEAEYDLFLAVNQLTPHALSFKESTLFYRRDFLREFLAGFANVFGCVNLDGGEISRS